MLRASATLAAVRPEVVLEALGHLPNLEMPRRHPVMEAADVDPARYAFAHGGKDGTPFPVDRATYDRTIEVMRHALDKAHIGRTEKVAAFRRLATFTSA